MLTFGGTPVIINNVADGMLLCELYGLVVQLVRTLACHARGRGFEPHPGRQPILGYAFVAQLVEQRTENPRVVGSIPTGATTFMRV